MITIQVRTDGTVFRFPLFDPAILNGTLNATVVAGVAQFSGKARLL